MNELEIFLEALDREPAERAAFLDAACASDAGLRQRLEALLRAHAQADSFLQVPAPLQLRKLYNEAPDSELAQATEPYNITLRFVGNPTQTFKDAANAAARRWERAITAGLPNVSGSFSPSQQCGASAPDFSRIAVS